MKALFTLIIVCTVSVLAAQNNYEFIFKYGINKKNILDTKENKFTKDMVTDSAITTELKLTVKEKKHIYKKLMEIGFFELPEKYQVKIMPDEKVAGLSPCSQYELIVLKNGNNKSVSWNNCIVPATVKDEQFDQLMELTNLINSILTKKKEYRNLPDPKGKYY